MTKIQKFNDNNKLSRSTQFAIQKKITKVTDAPTAKPHTVTRGMVKYGKSLDNKFAHYMILRMLISMHWMLLLKIVIRLMHFFQSSASGIPKALPLAVV